MITDPAQLADVMVWEAFFPFFGEHLPQHLGSETFKTTLKRLSVEGYPDVEHTQEVFARSLTKGLGFLDGHGGESVRNPRPWFHTICRHEATRYLIDADAHDSAAVLSLMEGDTDLFDATIYDPQRVDELLRKALDQIPPRHREFIRLDLAERLSAPEIEKRMGIQSHRYFLKLKSEAFSLLREAVKVLIAKEISSHL
jgi:DNA-directed RNA polymerase specialized sigma24 family protein